MTMRSYRQSRSIVTLFVWTAAFVAMAAVAAWQYGWITDAGPSKKSRTAKTSEPAAEAVEPAPEPAPPARPVDDSIFADQTEPPFEDTPAPAGEIQQAGFQGEPPPWEQQTAEPAPPRFLPTPQEARPIPPPQSETPPAQTPEPDVSTSLPDSPPAQPYRRVVPAGGDPAPFAQTALNDAPDDDAAAPPADARLAEIDALIAQGQFDPKNFIAAHKALSEIYWKEPRRRPEIQERIDRTAKVIYFSPQPHVMTPYVFNPGDRLVNVAKTYHVPWEFLVRLNAIKPEALQAGQRLKVIKGPFAAVVELSRFELTVHHHGYYVRRYPIGIGRDGATPAGEFTVLNKQANPEYTHTDPETGLRRRIPADDPRNPIGERWIDLGDSYGIHGTIDPDSIGKAESAGCLRMHNADVEEVYDLLGKGSTVIIRP